MPPPKPDKKRRVTIKDVAKIAGVHFTTVSMVMRNHPSIPQVTRDRVHRAANRLGYRRDPVFGALAHFHVNGGMRPASPHIGFVINRAWDKDPIFFPHYQAMLSGAQRQARTLGYELEVIDVSEHSFDSFSVEETLGEKKISGLILANFEPSFASFSLDWNDYTTVKINSMHMAPETTLVSSNHLQDVRIAFKRLAALGYGRIGLALGRSDDEATNRRLTAGYFVEEAAVPALRRIPPLWFPFNAPASEVVRALGRWVRQHSVDAVICTWPNVDELLHAARIKPAESVACASLSVIEPSSPVAGVRPNYTMVGVKAVSLLATQLKSGERGVPEFASTTYVQSSWQDGPSAPPKN